MTRTIAVHIEFRDGEWLGCMTCPGQDDFHCSYKSEAEALEKMKAAIHVAGDLMVEGLVTRIVAQQFPVKQGTAKKVAA